MSACDRVRSVRIVLVLFVLIGTAGTSRPAVAQGVATGSIAGVVKDASGGVLR